jgi:uncharacterized protein YcfJ
MKQSFIFAAMGLAACGVAAQEVGTVVSSTPVVQQVAVPHQVCGQGYAPVQGPTSGGGALLGAIAGAAIGSTIGGGVGQAAAIGIGAVAGGAVGNNIEANNNARYAAVPTCTTQMSYENRTVGYNVTYEYNGRQYQAQLPSDPGPTIRLRVTPVGEVRPVMRMYRNGPVAGAGPVTAPPMQYSQQQPQMQYQQQPQMQYQQQQQPMQYQQQQQPMAMPEAARNYGEAVPPEQERQGTNTSAAESGNAVMFGYGNPYGYGYPAYGYGYPAYGYAYPAVYGAAVIPAYRPWIGVGYRPWGGYYRPWGYRPWGGVSFGFGYRGRWR